MPQTILAVDDNANALALLVDFLTEQGFQVLPASNGQAALTIMDAVQPDLVLLDVMMPQMDGYQFISRVRRNGNVPVIMLTAKQREEDVVRGFELGADDYITKPYRMRELLMRIRAVLRRSGSGHSAETETVGPFTLTRSQMMISLDKEILNLTPAEYHLMDCLLSANGAPVHRAALSTCLIERGFSGTDATLKIHIRNLRQKIERDASTPNYIRTVFGVGYRLDSNA